MTIRFDHLERSVKTLETSLDMLAHAEKGSVEYEVFRNSVIKGFELCLETTGSLLRKVLERYMDFSKQRIAGLPWKQVMREAAAHGLMTMEEVERWFAYRDGRNRTAHDYGEQLAEDILGDIERFHDDVRQLLHRLIALQTTDNDEHIE